MSKREIALLLRRLFSDYKRRFHERAPQDEAPVPLLAQKRVDVVAVNGGRVLHFFFSEPVDRGDGIHRIERMKPITRLHDVTLWPPTVHEQKEVAREGPQVQRELVRRVARIRGALYVHFVLYPEDGGLYDSIGAVGERLAEREVARSEGQELDEEVPDEYVVSPVVQTRRWGSGLDPALRPGP